MMKNKEVVTELYRCFRQQDVERFTQLCSPSIIWQQNQGFPGEGTHQGPSAVLSKVYKSFNLEWQRWHFVIERMLDAGEDIVVLGYFSGVKRDTKEHFKLAASHIYSFKQSKVVKFQQYTDEQTIVHTTSADKALENENRVLEELA
jgi:ketosteroid isomerase-like protein